MPVAPVELLALIDDEQRGFALWNWWVALECARRGIPFDQLTSEQKEQIRVDTIGMDTESALAVGVEKSLKLAAKGHFERAGKLWLRVIELGGHHLAAVNTARREHATRMRGPLAGGRESARRAQGERAVRNRSIVEARDGLLAKGTPPREVAGKLAARLWEGRKLSAKQIRDILKKAADR